MVALLIARTAGARMHDPSVGLDRMMPARLAKLVQAVDMVCPRVDESSGASYED